MNRSAPAIAPADAAKTRANDPCWCGSGKKFKRCHKVATTRVQRGEVSPRRSVPPEIDRPHYAEKGGTDRRDEPMVKDADTLDRMRRTGAAAAEILRAVGALVEPGITTDELDAACHQACIDRGGYPSPLNYGLKPPFPKSVCTSVNEVICHGIPDSRVLVDGDIVNLDVTLFREGVHGDTNATFLVGTVDAESRRLVRTTRECLERGIAAVRPGRPIRDIGQAIQDHADANRLGVVRAFIGHGIGREFHTGPEILHYPDPRSTTVMVPGMTFTIEPMLAQGAWQHRMWDDGWTVVTTDGRRSAQFEHTLVVTDDGAELLTLHPDGNWSGWLG
jgi:methionyl aminopeptidase